MNPLIDIFSKLKQNSKDSVCGDKLSDFQKSLYVQRPVEKELLAKMDQIRDAGGGLILLIGSAGDGKTSLLCSIKDNNTDFDFRRDATEIFSPELDCVQSIMLKLDAFTDDKINTTHKKLVIPFNSGKLAEFVQDPRAQIKFSYLIELLKPLVDNDSFNDEIDELRVKTIQFNTQQIFELDLYSSSEYPVNSVFLKGVLENITKKDKTNPFYDAYIKAKANMGSSVDPIVVNYDLLCLPYIQDSIVKYVIESIVRFGINVTPRLFLDFIAQVIVPNQQDEYNENKNFFEWTLPCTLFECQNITNKIQKCFLKLDPLHCSNSEHDNLLTNLNMTHGRPYDFLEKKYTKEFPVYYKNKIEEFYSKEHEVRIYKYYFRLHHLLNYHTDCPHYKDYLQVLKCYFLFSKGEKSIMKVNSTVNGVENLVKKGIIKHYGSYFSKKIDIIPLFIQGKKYKIFADIKIKSSTPLTVYHTENPDNFLLFVKMKWIVKDTPFELVLNYSIYDYLCDLRDGKLTSNNQSNKNMEFDKFVRQINDKCTSDSRILIIGDNGEEMYFDIENDQINLDYESR